jgi:hypothetical protein
MRLALAEARRFGAFAAWYLALESGAKAVLHMILLVKSLLGRSAVPCPLLRPQVDAAVRLRAYI